jgi:hypothetical protein
MSPVETSHLAMPDLAQSRQTVGLSVRPCSWANRSALNCCGAAVGGNLQVIGCYGSGLNVPIGSVIVGVAVVYKGFIMNDAGGFEVADIRRSIHAINESLVVTILSGSLTPPGKFLDFLI